MKTLNKFTQNNKMTVYDYPRDEKTLLKVREKLNTLLKKACTNL
jgi:hypothetical protein